MDNREAVNWLINISADIGKVEHSDLWHYERALTEIKDMLESIQPVATDTNVGNNSEIPNSSDTVSRQQAIDALDDQIKKCCKALGSFSLSDVDTHAVKVEMASIRAYREMLENLPTIQPEERTEKRTETHACDLIDREAAVDAIYHHLPSVSRTEVRLMLHEVSSVQPERTCVNCGRTVNNGGWYADGGTRCPIEEHYALPKNGYCHLWEERNVTDDDYPERREE